MGVILRGLFYAYITAVISYITLVVCTALLNTFDSIPWERDNTAETGIVYGILFVIILPLVMRTIKRVDKRYQPRRPDGK